VVAAQRGAASGQRGTPSRAANPPRADTGSVRRTPTGFVLDFQDQPLRVVLSAIAEAGGLNVSLSNIPARNVTVRMGQSTSRDSMSAIFRSIAENNGLKVSQTTSLISVQGPVPEDPLQVAQQRQQALAQQFTQQAAVKLFTYRLKHASAVQLAPVLTSLFTGSTTNFGNGFQVFNPNGNAINIGPGRGGGVAPAGAGRAGFGNNGAATPVNPNINPNANLGQTTIVTQTPGGAIAQQLFNQIQAGALSAQAGQIRIVAEESTNSLLIRATDSDWTLIQQIVGGIDLRPLQVLVEVTIAEVTRTHNLDLGVSGSVQRRAGNAFDSAGVISQASANDFVLALTGGHGAIDYSVAISALQLRGNVRIISLPVIIAQNNKQAVLTVGQSVPFVQVSQSLVATTGSVVQTVQYQDVGTVLTITPTINPDGYVNLQVQQSDNSATNAVQFNAPIISKREATTQVFIHDGQTTVIGGLAGNTRNHQISGIPFLSSIPLIGPLLFGRTVIDDEVTELFLFLTPHVISSDDDIDRLRDAVQNHSELLKTVPIGPNIVPVADTMRLRLDSLRRVDSLRRTDSLRTLRRRPPASPASPVDTTQLPAPAPASGDRRLPLAAARRADSAALWWAS
jgi:type II secretory pathway component GspD/PulD (secretin)